MIRTIKTSLLILQVFCFSSCMEFFNPDLGDNIKAKYVVDGQITNQEGYQSVYISTTATMEKPNYNPVSFCKVNITDNFGNVFKLEELVNERGHYRVWMGEKNLKPGTSYQLKIVTASGIEIVSDFDQMPECPKVDSVYFERKDFLSSDPNKENIQGIQFYVDFNRGNTNSNFYKWEIVETWEHHAVYPITWYFDPDTGWVNNPIPDFTRLKCWTTKKMSDFFTLSTENITQNNYKMFPLHYVDNQSQRLTFCYSALVFQYAISETAYKYWSEMHKNNSEQGGLYNTQPLRIKGNLKSSTNPELEILGIFYAFSIQSKRIIVKDLENFDFFEPICVPPYLENPSVPEPHKYEIEIDGTKYILPDACVECDYMSGSTTKPSYWPY